MDCLGGEKSVKTLVTLQLAQISSIELEVSRSPVASKDEAPVTSLANSCISPVSDSECPACLFSKLPRPPAFFTRLI